FRDTAHGFLAWSIASLATAALLSSVAASIVGGGVQAGATVAAGAASAAGTAVTQNIASSDKGSEAANGNAYFIDALFRAGNDAPASASAPSPAAATAEASTILLNALRQGSLPPEDADHLARQVAQRTGLDASAARQRVTDAFGRMQSKA